MLLAPREMWVKSVPLVLRAMSVQQEPPDHKATLVQQGQQAPKAKRDSQDLQELPVLKV